MTELYFKSRGPATVSDFSWWSGLSMADARLGVGELGRELQLFILNDLQFYYFGSEQHINLNKPLILLPCFDEYMVGYSKGRNVALPVDLEISQYGNGVFKQIVIYGNEIVGLWKKNKKQPLVEILKFLSNKEIPPKDIKNVLNQMYTFIEEK